MSEEQRSFYGLEKLWTGEAPPEREPERLAGMGIGEFDDDSEDDEEDEEIEDDKSEEDEIEESESEHKHAPAA